MDVFVVRQPIFDRSRRTYAYQVTCRAARDPLSHTDPDREALGVTDAASQLIGARHLTGRHRAFLNFSRDTLVRGHTAILPSASLVIEVAAAAGADAAVIDACGVLRKAGRLIALDGVAADGPSPALLKVADIVKVDFARTRDSQRRALARRFRGLGIRLIATKVATEDDWRQARDAGYEYGEGDCFSKPAVTTTRDVPLSRLHVLQLLHKIYQPDAELAQIEAIVRSEVSLALKLLTYLNSAAFGLRQRVTSVRQALLLIGVNGIRQWASAIAVADAAGNVPFELVVTSIVRAKFCELLAADAGMGARAEDAFFLGLFSMLDVLLGRPRAALVGTLSVADDVRHALLGGANPLRRLFELVLAYERGDWNGAVGWAATLTIPIATIPDRYCASLEWGNAMASIAPGA